MDKKAKKHSTEEVEQPKIFGNPEYSADEDIYTKGKKEELSDSDDDGEIIKGKEEKILTGEDLDVPGSELDDKDEKIGEEDEENNYYSLGGDNHEDLEEDKGD